MPFVIKTVCTHTWEIRRFFVEQPPTIEELRQMIGKVYGCCMPEIMRFAYVDCENDFVSIKTTEDIACAMDLFKTQQQLKIFICICMDGSCGDSETCCKTEGEGKCCKEEKEKEKCCKEGTEKCCKEGKEECCRSECEKEMAEIMKKRKMVMKYMMHKFCPSPKMPCGEKPCAEPCEKPCPTKPCGPPSEICGMGGIGMHPWMMRKMMKMHMMMGKHLGPHGPQGPCGPCGPIPQFAPQGVCPCGPECTCPKSCPCGPECKCGPECPCPKTCPCGPCPGTSMSKGCCK